MPEKAQAANGQAPASDNLSPRQPETTPAEQVPNPQSGEIGGPQGPEPTRYGDWERKGRCIDF